MRRKSESPSSISCYLGCPKKYQFKYFHKLPDPSGPAAEFGSMFHQAAYDSWDTQSTEHKDPQISKMLEAMYANEDVQSLEKEKLIEGNTCEYQINVECGNQILLGYIDIVYPEIIIDLKTASKKWDNEKVDTALQHFAYTYGARKHEISEAKEFWYVVVGSKGNPFVQVFKIKISDAVMEKFIQEFSNTVTKIELDLFPPMPSEGYKPPCCWCPYKKVCPAFNPDSPYKS